MRFALYYGGAFCKKLPHAPGKNFSRLLRKLLLSASRSLVLRTAFTPPRLIFAVVERRFVNVFKRFFLHIVDIAAQFGITFGQTPGVGDLSGTQ